MNQLISKLEDPQKVDLSSGYPAWAYGLIGVAFAVIIVIGVILYFKFRNKCRDRLTAKGGNENKQSVISPDYRYNMVTTVPGDLPDRTSNFGLARIASAPLPTGTNHVALTTLPNMGADNFIKKMYPTLNMTTT